MPKTAQTALPKPETWREFEQIISDIYARRWSDPHADLCGRAGHRHLHRRPPAPLLVTKEPDMP